MMMAHCCQPYVFGKYLLRSWKLLMVMVLLAGVVTTIMLTVMLTPPYINMTTNDIKYGKMTILTLSSKMQEWSRQHNMSYNSTVYEEFSNAYLRKYRQCAKYLKIKIYQNYNYKTYSDPAAKKMCNCGNDTNSKLERNELAVVPNILHYIWFGEHPFRFDHLISIFSAYRILKPDRIMFHGDNKPTGKYWEEVKEEVADVLELHYRAPPTGIFGNSVSPRGKEHMADILRLEILLEYGGIYMDLDVIVVKSLEPLRHYDFVLGHESQNRLNNGVMIAKQNSDFLKVFYLSYEFFWGRCWGCDSICFPSELAKMYPHLIHAEYNMIPFWSNRYDTLKNIGYDKLVSYYAIHTFINSMPEEVPLFTLDSIKTANTSFAKLCRNVYFGEQKYKF